MTVPCHAAILDILNFHRSVPMDLVYGVVGDEALYISLDRNVAC